MLGSTDDNLILSNHPCCTRCCGNILSWLGNSLNYCVIREISCGIPSLDDCLSNVTPTHQVLQMCEWTQYHVIRLIACSAKVVFVADKGSYRAIVGFVHVTICVVMHWWPPDIELLLPCLNPHFQDSSVCLHWRLDHSLVWRHLSLQIIVLKKSAVCTVHCIESSLVVKHLVKRTTIWARVLLFQNMMTI